LLSKYFTSGTWHHERGIMNNQIMFRQEVLQQKQAQSFGVVLINTPGSIRYSLVILSFIMLGFILLFFIGNYSTKYLVRGYLNTNPGITSIYGPQPGILKKIYHRAGDHVKEGEVLFLINTSTIHTNDNLYLQQLNQRKQFLAAEIEAKNNYLKKLNLLLDKGYLSKEAYDLKENELYSLRQSLHGLTLEKIAYKQDKHYLLKSPIEGTLSGLNYGLGQFINPSKPLTKIIPVQTYLIGELYIPVSQIGFIEKNMPLHIRLDAFPYQHFGTVSARIYSIAKSILTDGEDNKPFEIGQPYYKALAHLNNSSLIINDHPKKLLPGMTFIASIQGPKRKIWQWVFAPIRSFYRDDLQ
jgi:membrane fusion protein